MLIQLYVQIASVLCQCTDRWTRVISSLSGLLTCCILFRWDSHKVVIKSARWRYDEVESVCDNVTGRVYLMYHVIRVIVLLVFIIWLV